MALTNSAELATRLGLLRSHGITSDPFELEARPEAEIWNYQQLQLGFNYRMTEMQAALGLSQLKQLDAFVLKRHALATVYDKALQDLPLITPWQHPDSYSSYHLYAVLIPKTDDGPSQRQVYRAMHKAGIQVNLHYIPVYLQPFYAAMGFKRGYCPKAEAYFKQTISIPLYANLQPDEQSRVIKQLFMATTVDSSRFAEKLIA